MIRTLLASVLALVGAALAVRSPFLTWYAGRHGTDIRVDDLFTGVGVTPDGAALFGSLFLPTAFAALLTLLGVLLRSRFVIALAGLLVLGVTILWMVRQAQAAGSLTAGGDGLDYGVANAFAGGLLILLAAYLLVPRPGRLTAFPPPPSYAPAPPLDATQPLPFPDLPEADAPTPSPGPPV